MNGGGRRRDAWAGGALRGVGARLSRGPAGAGARETPAHWSGCVAMTSSRTATRATGRRSYSRTEAPEVATETLSLVESIARRLYFWAPITRIRDARSFIISARACSRLLLWHRPRSPRDLEIFLKAAQ